MSPPSSSEGIARFGDFSVDLHSSELRKHGTRIKLQVQPFQVLQVLLEHPGEVVTREELQKRIWPSDTFVDFDQGLNNAVKKLREALGDDADKPRFIETLPKRGYRFLGTVNRGGAAEVIEPKGEEEAPKRLRWLRPAAALVLLAILAATLVLGLNLFGIRGRVLGSSRVSQIHSLAVLPLRNLSTDPGQEYFSDGMTDTLITDLAQISSLKVISHTSTMQYKDTRKSLPEIARELNVDGIIEGTVQRSGDRVRINAQLIHGPTDNHMWANSYERDMHDVFALERDVTADIAHQVQARVRAPDQVQTPLRPVNPKALDAYLQGNAHLHRFSRGSGDDELKRAMDYFRQAIDADADFAPAYVGMSSAHYMTLLFSNDEAEIARKAAERAVQLDPSLSEAWKLLADIRGDYWDWHGAEEDYRRALALNPNNADAHDGLGDLLDEIGRLDEGWKESQNAQQLDPNHDHLVYPLEKRHEYDRAIEVILTMLISDPNNGILHHQLYEAYSAKGMHKEAVEQLEQTFTLYGFPQVADKLRSAFAASGYMRAMREYAKELERLHATNQLFIPVNLAAVYAALGDKDRAFYWLERGSEHRGNAGVNFSEIRVYPGLDPLRSDPRFNDLLRRIGLPP